MFCFKNNVVKFIKCMLYNLFECVSVRVLINYYCFILLNLGSFVKINLVFLFFF